MRNHFEELEHLETKKDILEGVMDSMEKDYFSLLDDIDALEEEKRGKLEEIIEIDIPSIRRFIDEKMPKLLERMNDEVRKRKIEIITGNSVTDVMKNSVIAGIAAVKKTIEGIKNGKVESGDDLKVAYRDMLIIFQNIFSYGNYYLDDLCTDEAKLEMELSKTNGYLEKFDAYFHKTEAEKNGEMEIKTKFPVGSKKVLYFVFFSKLEKKEFTPEEAEIELAKLDESYLNKEKLRADIESGDFWKK
ncbi:MAG: hypothetical protein COX30_04640 [Candidatus Moranbacteria bacterium CG23_combo_of_CG06-09_8_20_14_all_39_10]|nr:MAG: hypothetical protein COX30_04640 [Candidatus Moranbacteria bacterium CG23_combo_of_CG06-09_8_20_14_all_39_10]